MQNHLEEDSDWQEPEEAKIPWELVARVGLLLFGYLWIAILTGSADYSLGRKAAVSYVWLDQALRLVFYFGFIHIMLFWPIANYVNPSLRKKSIPVRFAAWMLLICPPLLSFGYYLGDFQTVVDIRELVISVFFPVMIGLIFFEKTQKLWIFSLIVSVSTYLSFFFVNDILGPFATIVYYSSKNASIYFWRVLTPVLALLTTVIQRFHPLTVDQEC